MPLEESEPLTLTEYLGCLHGFIGQFQNTIFMVRSLAGKLRGQTRSTTFGWASAFDQARYRAPLMAERWRHFNETARGRLTNTPEERERYAPVPSPDHTLDVCRELDDMLARMNRFIDTLETFTPDDVRIIGEMVEALDQELASDRQVAARIAALLEAQANDVTVTPDKDTGLLMIGGMNDGTDYPGQFAGARESFAHHLGLG